MTETDKEDWAYDEATDEALIDQRIKQQNEPLERKTQAE